MYDISSKVSKTLVKSVMNLVAHVLQRYLSKIHQDDSLFLYIYLTLEKSQTHKHMHLHAHKYFKTCNKRVCFSKEIACGYELVGDHK